MNTSKEASVKSNPYDPSSKGLRIDLTNKVNINLSNMLPKLDHQSPTDGIINLSRSSKCLPTLAKSPVARNDEVLDRKTRTYIADGEGTDNASSAKIAGEKQVTTANIDRWKRTFQALKGHDKKKVESAEDSQDEGVRAFYDRSQLSQASVFFDEPRPVEDIFEEIAMKDTHPSWGVINPESTMKMVWDMVNVTLIVIEAIMIPFKIAFSYNAALGWHIFETCVDFYFIFDLRISFSMSSIIIVLSFNTGFYRDGTLIMTRSQIVLDYLTSWFFVDLISTFPYSWLVDGCFFADCDSVSVFIYSGNP